MGDLEDLARAAQNQKRSRSAQEAVGYPMSPQAAYPPPNPAYAPPPVPTPQGVARVWMVHDQGRQFGPHTELELASLVAAGTISPTAMAWRDGSPRWIPVSAVVPLPAHLPPAYPSPYAQVQSSNRIAVGLVAIFLGCIGIHKFMFGATTAGVVMLLISLVGGCAFGIGPALMAIVGLIEGIIYLTKTDAQFHQEYEVGKRAWF